jgi:hypothetical protein
MDWCGLRLGESKISDIQMDAPRPNVALFVYASHGVLERITHNVCLFTVDVLVKYIYQFDSWQPSTRLDLNPHTERHLFTSASIISAFSRFEMYYINSSTFLIPLNSARACFVIML